jgi:hypothetical protein
VPALFIKNMSKSFLYSLRTKALKTCFTETVPGAPHERSMHGHGKKLSNEEKNYGTNSMKMQVPYGSAGARNFFQEES